MRKMVVYLLGLLILLGAVGTMMYLKNNKKQPKKAPAKTEKTVFTETVKNREIPIVVVADGNLIAKQRVELFSEVQGVLQATGKSFKVGERYSKGQTLLRINNEEHYATLQSQKSSLQNLIVAMMPDLRLDYPESFQEMECIPTKLRY